MLRSIQKDQNMDASSAKPKSLESLSNHKHTNNSFFTVAGLFLGQGPKVLSECDSAMSPTSPLDFKLLPSLGSPFRARRSWDRGSKVGLSIVDSLDDNSELGGVGSKSMSKSKSKPASDGKNIVFGPQLRIRTSTLGSRFDMVLASKSLPKDYPLAHQGKSKRSAKSIFEIADALEPEQIREFKASCSLGSCRQSLFTVIAKSKLGLSSNMSCGNLGSDKLSQSLPESGIELSEEYTCVTTNGANPKTVHIFGDCVLRCHSNVQNLSVAKLLVTEEVGNMGRLTMSGCADVPNLLPSSDFLSSCYSCSKDLAGKDVYIYRGEKAFCSPSCRELEMEDEDKAEEAGNGVAEGAYVDPHDQDCASLSA
uniref:FLZ-type domain-containing protein n=1 Tax=Kalanchoe fedtschenkoi TaxID=63787 RepID=A0A7N0TAW4_KALFE